MYLVTATATRRIAFSSLRSYSTQNPPKVSAKLAAELRKRTELPLSKVREALLATDNNFDAALEWILKDLPTSGARKAAKLQDRSTKEGLIGVSVISKGVCTPNQAPGVRAAMVEVNCETDFVSRNELFGQLVDDLAYTTAFVCEKNEGSFTPCPLNMLYSVSLLSPRNPNQQSGATVATAINDLIARFGENISLRRAGGFVNEHHRPLSQQFTKGFRAASYAHGSVPSRGRIGTLALLALTGNNSMVLNASQPFCNDLQTLERSLARQIVGFETSSIRSTDAADETALYNQPFMMFPGGQSGFVREVLRNWAKEREMVSGDAEDEKIIPGVDVVDFAKWTVGEKLDESVCKAYGT